MHTSADLMQNPGSYLRPAHTVSCYRAPYIDISQQTVLIALLDQSDLVHMSHSSSTIAPLVKDPVPD